MTGRADPPGTAAGRGLLSIACPRCEAPAGEWCRRRAQNVNRQHDERYDAWRAAGKPVLGTIREGR